MDKAFIIDNDVPGMPSIAPVPSFRQGPAKCSQKATPVDIFPVTTIKLARRTISASVLRLSWFICRCFAAAKLSSVLVKGS